MVEGRERQSEPLPSRIEIGYCCAPAYRVFTGAGPSQRAQYFDELSSERARKYVHISLVFPIRRPGFDVLTLSEGTSTSL